MSGECVIPNCTQIARVKCFCCQRNMCCFHDDEHRQSIKDELVPLTDRYNNVNNRIVSLNVNDMTADSRQKLAEWRDDYHRKVNYMFNQKCRELEERAAANIDKLKKNTAEIRATVGTLLDRQDANRQAMESAQSNLRVLEQILDGMERRPFTVTTQPITLDQHCIDIEEFNEHHLKFLALEVIFKTINRPNGSHALMASNERFLLFHQKPDLCLVDKELNAVKRTKWKEEKIQGMCWSATLKQFFVIDDHRIFAVHEQLNSIKKIQIVDNRVLYSCTCSDRSLFVSTHDMGTSILEYKLLPTVELVKEWKSPLTCQDDEWVNDINCHERSIVLVIKNPTNKTYRIELANANTFERLWQRELRVLSVGKNAVACCALAGNGWFVIDTDNNQLLYITADGNIGAKQTYREKLWCANLFGSDLLAITTDAGINFHKL